MHKPIINAKCSYCNKKFSTIQIRNKHIKAVHTEERNFKCEKCEKSFKRPAHLNSHMKSIHEEYRSWKCEECDFSTRREDSLRTHKERHSAGRERKFPCPLCVKTFFTKSTLINHTKVHTGDKPHHCQVCDTSYRTPGDLSSHQRVHFQENRHIFPCAECGKSFTAKSSLKTHSLQHTGESPFKCQFCDRRFKQSGHARHHEISVHKHGGE